MADERHNYFVNQIDFPNYSPIRAHHMSGLLDDLIDVLTEWKLKNSISDIEFAFMLSMFSHAQLERLMKHIIHTSEFRWFDPGPERWHLLIDKDDG